VAIRTNGVNNAAPEGTPQYKNRTPQASQSPKC